MSTIYEALRKAEERRRLGEAPSLIGDAAWATRRPAHAPESRRRWMLWLLPAIVAALAGGWWLGRGSGAIPAPSNGASTVADSTPAAATPAVETPAAATAAVAIPAAPIAAVPQNPTPVPAIAPPAATSAIPAQDVAPAPTATPAPVVASPAAMANPGASGPHAGFVAPVPDENAAVVAGAPTPAPAAIAEPIPPAPTAPAEIALQPMPAMQAAPGAAALVAPTPAPAAIAPLPSPPVAIAPPPAAPGAPPLHEMPLGTRQALPPLKLSMHVYSPDPARRVVIIDGARLLEGETVAGELRVSQITPDGVVLVLGDQQFLLPRGGR
jgi:general secretion pathway protein B